MVSPFIGEATMQAPGLSSPVVKLAVNQLRVQVDALRRELVAAERDLANLSAKLDAMAAGGTPVTVSRTALLPGQQMQPMSVDLLRFQNAIQEETRKFQTLANAAKARHDAAMNTIRNMKA